MNYLDIYYRALIDYRKNTGDFRDCVNQRISTTKADPKNDKLTITRKICTVETDWVDAIEEGLVHVEKALREERQFIRSQGEVVDIEKVKNVSRDSVEHLARHSNLITRYEEGEEIIPDRLYTVERLSDYAVYENRFLYMLLCYLRDFITVRYNKILELEHTYLGNMSMNKTIVMTKRNIAFSVNVEEERKDDYYLKKQSESRDIIVKIGNQLKLVIAFLATPLMQEVSKVAMLKPPITKTNVLRMNHNFRGALALYEFVSAYDKPGYSVSEKVTTQNPFRLEVADEMAEIVMLASFLTYEHGLNLKEDLQEEYDKEEERRKEEEKRRLLEQLKALRHRIRESGGDPEEYMLMLEKANRLLQEDRENLQLAKQEIEILKGEISTLENKNRELSDEIDRLNGVIVDLKEKHAREIAEMEQRHADEINMLMEVHAAEIQQITDEYEEKLDNQRIDYERQLEDQKADYEGQLEDQKADYEGQLDVQRQDYEGQLLVQKAGYEEQLENQKADYEGQLEAQKNGYEAHIGELNHVINTERVEHQNTVYRIEGETARVIDGIRGTWQADVHGLKSLCGEKDASIALLRHECETLEMRRRVSDGRLTAIRAQNGLVSPNEAFATQQEFEELERQYDAFVAFFKTQWGITKKTIRAKAIKEWRDGVKARKEEKRQAKLAKKNARMNAGEAQISEEDQKINAIIHEIRGDNAPDYRQMLEQPEKNAEVAENVTENAEAAENVAESAEVAENVAESAEVAENVAESAEVAENVAESAEVAENVAESAEVAENAEAQGATEEAPDPEAQDETEESFDAEAAEVTEEVSDIDSAEAEEASTGDEPADVSNDTAEDMSVPNENDIDAQDQEENKTEE